MVKVRRAVDADAAAIAAVHVRSWQAAYRGIVGDEVLDTLSVAERAARWHERIAGSRAVVLVAERDGDVVGFCGAVGEEIGALYVDPPVWREGLGSALLAATVKALRDAGATHVTLWVYEANDRARGFYARHGFAPDGATQIDERGVPELRMQRAAGIL